jgi:hypothetical protein
MHFGWRVAETDHSSKLQYLTQTKVGEKEVFINVKINATLMIKLLMDRGSQAGTNSILQNGPRWQILARKRSLESLMSLLLKPGKTKLGTSSKYWTSCGYTMLHQKPQNLAKPKLGTPFELLAKAGKKKLTLSYYW